MLKQKMKKIFFSKERLEKEVSKTKGKTTSKKKTSIIEKGITLIALVVTIIILLILAGITIGMITGDNGLFQKASSSRETSRGGEVKEYVSLTLGDNELAKLMNKPVTNKAAAVQDLLSKGKLTGEEAEQLETVDAITIGGIEVDFSGLNGNQELTLGAVYTDDMIGQKLTYSSNEQSEWIVFGKDESGNVLITTKEPINANYEVPLTVEAWLDYEDNLNAACAGYGGEVQGKTVTSRSITLKDINYVSGYTEPEFDTYTFGTEYDFESKKVNYLYPKKGATTTIGDKTYTNWMKATKESESQTFGNNCYDYDYRSSIATGTETSGSGDTGSDTQLLNLDKLKFIWGDEENRFDYAVASRSVGVYTNRANFLMADVNDLRVGSYNILCYSDWYSAYDNGSGGSRGLRPVVVLPSDINRS